MSLKNLLKHKYIYWAHKAEHRHHLDTVSENAKIRDSLLYMGDTKI